jgi:ATP-dependent Clp protease protease subunit
MNECDKTKEQNGQAEALGGRLLKARLVMITGQIDQEVAERTVSQLLVLDAESKDPIRVIVTSQGGHVDSGFAIHDVMRFIDAPVTAIGAGWVASIAVPILCGAPKERRFCLPNTRFLLHQPSGGAGGQLADLRIEAQEILKIRERLNKLIADETGKDINQIAKDSDRNFWMSAEEALKYGLISSIVTSASDVAKAAK